MSSITSIIDLNSTSQINHIVVSKSKKHRYRRRFDIDSMIHFSHWVSATWSIDGVTVCSCCCPSVRHDAPHDAPHDARGEAHSDWCLMTSGPEPHLASPLTTSTDGRTGDQRVFTSFCSTSRDRSGVCPLKSPRKSLLTFFEGEATPNIAV